MLRVRMQRVEICGWQMQLSSAWQTIAGVIIDLTHSPAANGKRAKPLCCGKKKNVVYKKVVLEGGGPWPNLSADLPHSQLFRCRKFLRFCAGDLAKLTGEPLTFSAWQAEQNERSLQRNGLFLSFSLFLCLSIFPSVFINVLNAK